MAVIICSSNEEGPLRCETKRVFCCHTPLFLGGASPLSVGLQIINPATVDSPKGNNRMGDDISFFSGILPSAGLVVSHPEVFPPMVKERKNTHENFAIYSIITTFADRKERRKKKRNIIE